VHDCAHVSRREARAARANQKAADRAPVIAELRAAGITGLGVIAAALTKRGIPTPNGWAYWRAVLVSRC
jgi:hypothetical protein